LIKFNSSV